MNSLAAALSPFFDALGSALLVGGLATAAADDVSPVTLVPPTVAGVAAAVAAGKGAGTDLEFCAVTDGVPPLVPDVPAAAVAAGVPTVASAGTLLMAATSDELADVATLSEQVAAPDGARTTDDIVDVTTEGDLVLEPASASASVPVATFAAAGGAGGGGSVSTPTDATEATSEPARTVMEVMEPASDATSSIPLTSAGAGMSSFDTSDRWDGARADRPDRRSADCR